MEMEEPRFGKLNGARYISQRSKDSSGTVTKVTTITSFREFESGSKTFIHKFRLTKKSPGDKAQVSKTTHKIGTTPGGRPYIATKEIENGLKKKKTAVFEDKGNTSNTNGKKFEKITGESKKTAYRHVAWKTELLKRSVDRGPMKPVEPPKSKKKSKSKSSKR